MIKKINGWDLYIKDGLLEKLEIEYKTKNITPSKEDIFKVFELLPFEKVKVVIIGQDPYPKQGDANGIAFSVSRKSLLPASLKNLYKELESDLGVVRTNGDLTNIVKQGILLVNTSLTVEVGSPKSHSFLGWEDTIIDVVKKLDESGNKIFVLLGNDSQKYEKFIANENSYIIKAVHPSPLSAYRGFFGSKIYSKINKILISKGYSQINWDL